MTTFNLGNGNDNFFADPTDDQVFGNGGNDSLNGAEGSDSLFGGDGNDRLADGSGGDKDAYYGGDGNDTILAGFGDFGDIVEGGAGNDLLSLDYSLPGVAGISLTFGASFQVSVAGLTAITVSGVESLFLNASGGNDSIACGGGNDVVNLGGGQDMLQAGAGNDSITAWDVFDINGGQGDDLLVLTMTSETQAIQIDVLAGPIVVSTPNFRGTARGFERVNLNTGSGDDALSGGDLADTINGGQGNDAIHGGGGNDLLGGDSGANQLFGDAGDDVLNGQGTLAGGTGNDTLTAGATGGLLLGDGGDDDLRGGGGVDTLDGGAGNDRLGSIASGQMNGGTGDDTVSIGLNATPETLIGGSGDDVLILSSLTGGAITMAPAAGGAMDLLLAGVLVDSARGFERFSATGSTGADRLVGRDGADSLSGSSFGAGLADTDFLSGAGGEDVLSGRVGADTLLGGDGNDRLSGGEQGDRMTGGLGSDTFAYISTFESGVTDRDLITDFTKGQDRIDLATIDATPTDLATNTFHFLGRGGVDGGEGALSYHYQGQRTLITADRNGDMVIDFEIELLGRIALTALDFAL